MLIREGPRANVRSHENETTNSRLSALEPALLVASPHCRPLTRLPAAFRQPIAHVLLFRALPSFVRPGTSTPLGEELWNEALC